MLNCGHKVIRNKQKTSVANAVIRILGWNVLLYITLSHRALQESLDLTLETETDMAELDTELAKHQHSFTGFARQMWAYITLKQLIAER